MKLSLVFELLLIFVLIAFAASKSVRKQKNNKKGIQNRNDDNQLDDNNINKYCKCSEAYCNCCREFQLPVVNLDGPGCASLMYLSGDKMSVSLSFGKKVITNRTLSSRKPSPVCMPLPGGISKFCGRVYNIARAGEEFRACLGLELQSKSTVEAAVRVSCFKFGPRGVTSEPADPLPLVPQDEKDDDDDDEDDDDDDDDDFDLGDDDDDDDDDDGDLDAVNDVESADYTGFSILGEDLLGDIFGSSDSKKSNKNKNKQAPPASSTTTTTTRRPRPSRRPTRRPIKPSTTPRTIATRTTTVKVHPVTRRPTRKPNRRPNRPRPSRRPTTSSTTESLTTSTLTSPASVLTTPTTPATSVTTSSSTTTTPSTAPGVRTTERSQPLITDNDQPFEHVVVVTQRPVSTLAVTTTKSVTSFEDPGLEMSLAHITGQLSVMPVTPIISHKDSGMTTTIQGEMNYEKIKTITPKAPSTVSFATSSEEGISDDMVQIVQNLDSQSEEQTSEKDKNIDEESRSYLFNSNNRNSFAVPNDYYEGLALPKKKHRYNKFDYEDLDILGLSEIGETFGRELGIFGTHNKQNKNNKEAKENQGKRGNQDNDDVLGLEALSETLGFSGNKNKNKKDRRRQNKMMRGEWSLM